MKTFNRLFWRTAKLGVITFSAFALMQPITILTGWPEVMMCLGAAAKTAWTEHTALVLHVSTAPDFDRQEQGKFAATDKKGAAIMCAVHAGMWAMRVAVFCFYMAH